MALYDEIISIIEDESRIQRPAGSGDNLYTDLAFDSLTFISLLLRIENTFSIEFGIAQMEQCVRVDRLVALVAEKINEREGNDSKK